MDQNYSNNQNEFLWTLLANPANDAHLYNYNLQRLVNDFPQSGILQALLAHSADEKNLRQASVYFNAKALYKLINAPSSFIGVADEKIIVQHNIPSVRFNGHQAETTDIANTENYFSDHAAIETIAEPLTDHQGETLHEIGTIADAHHAEEATNEILDNHPVEEHLTEVHQTINEIPVEEHHVGEQIESYEHQALNEIPVEEHHVEESVATLEHQPENEIPVEEYYTEEHNVSYGHQPAHDIPVEEHHADEHISSHEHEPAQDSPVEEHWLSHTEETHEAVVVEHAEHPAEEPVAETHENSLAEIKDEVVHEIPAAEPIINYAQGLGHRMTRDPEEATAEDAHSEITHEAASAVHEEAVHVEHSVEDHAAEENVAPQPSREEPGFTDPVAAEYNGFAEPVHQHEEEQHAVADHVGEEHQAVTEQEHEYRHEETTNHTEEEHQAHVENEHADHHNIEEETFDEITGIENIDLEKDIISNIAASNYFSFDRAFGEHKEQEPALANEEVQPINAADVEADQQDVSKYHDEKLPYSFLWWLDKTRKEHSGIYQPYVAPENPEPVSTRRKSNTDELQQQYYENIFHITSVEELDKSLPPPSFEPTAFEPTKLKEQAIIERFIQEEPQIRPQSSDKLDNENKAKKSSEDRDELVSETLAAIYSDQMLYHKAIASYKKLMLRFPEKSRYFAEKIEQLEKKTN
ncbi:hypothetical protein KXD93_12370 [Mucilaginibacter sp. BJC16-A38]|uniref:hypothetical protein n=1 Tax=Mucilaginibacter phenanthrenivorans TaxID=1234842 RepID=UPI002156FCC6|nr:hypothetical protein [Mucilaginibacter phenanthrenivorans]MCR8558442.1 hypothetical protein [Mucilaginibacter phenanthrenivorans]